MGRLAGVGGLWSLSAFGLIFASTLAAALIMEEAIGNRVFKLALLNGSGGAFALLILWLAWTLLSPFKRPFALVFFLSGVIAAGLGILAFQLASHLVYFSTWHAPFFTLTYLFQLIHTAAGLAAILLTRGSVYFLPLAWLAPVLMAWGLKRRWIA